MGTKNKALLLFAGILIASSACTTANPAETASDSLKASSANSNEALEQEIEVTTKAANGKVLLKKTPCRMDDGTELPQKPEVKVGVSKKIGSKKKQVFVEYDCGTATAH